MAPSLEAMRVQFGETPPPSPLLLLEEGENIQISHFPGIAMRDSLLLGRFENVTGRNYKWAFILNRISGSADRSR